MIRAAIIALALALVAPAVAQADGEFVQVSGDPSGKVYRIVGSAPLWIGPGVCAATNGCQGLAQVNDLSAYRTYPADGALTHGGSDGATYGTYRWAGGAPLWISSCGYGPGCAAQILVDDVAYGDSPHVRQFPVDGTVVRNVTDGAAYRFAGGAPLLVRCDLGPGCADPTQVDGGTFERLGSFNGPKHMRSFPVDGTTVQNVEDGAYYRFAGNAALPLSGCAGCTAVMIDGLTLRLAGTGTPAQPHIAAAPAEGTFLRAGDAYYRVAGGAAIQLFDCSVLGGCPGAVAVDAGTISGLAGGRLLATPKDGTVLRGLPSKRTWEIVGGKKRETFIAGIGGIELDDAAIDRIAVDAPPPAPPVPFKPVISSGYKVYRTYTRFTSLKVRDALPGSVITVSCEGKRKGCPFKKQKYYRLKGTSLNVYSRWFKKAKLKSGATVTVRVSAPTGARKQMVFKIRSRKLPVRTTRCSSPGAKLGRCAS
ncbi:hypothetical protein OJ997_21090 [Solirubrobacter phytolaccae]|uniref:Uncharacterized protein n=1 Tax=Solirubrobacter phytolaccae TaxID=1404360 RepID=A0A9X3NBC8_9ACTN|nr:hypothetical protein [Solirubrobacter phytolaccae]MDA0182821.1 hypothetical protein [Solirubrobacter phytolaccae]